MKRLPGSTGSLALSLSLASSCALLAACGPEATPVPPPVVPVAAPPPSAAPPVADEPVPALRLPSDVHPTAEALELTIDPAQTRFSGEAKIDVTLDQPRSVVWLHGRGFHVTRATLTPDGGAPIAGTWAQKDEGGVAALSLASPAPAGKAQIVVAYDAPFTDGLVGLYRTKEAGASYAFTQFEAIDARRAFPCFDEPGFKIPFTTALIVPKDLVAIANTPETGRSPVADSVRVAFAPTPPLPSYLVAFAVGPLDVVSAPDVPPNEARSKPLPLRIITAKGRGGEASYAAARVGQIIATLEHYFGIPYPYPKLDILAVPDREGAMENAGAIDFQEDEILIDEKTAPTRVLDRFANVVAHEGAHQWFGDLVTMQWWNDIWLNESFATWMGHKAVASWDPKLNAGMTLLSQVQGSIGQDALASARRIRQPIKDRGDIATAFDGITYGKGAGVLRMFERWVGPDLFRRGVHEYLAAHAFGSATDDDFLDALSKAAGKDVKTPFHTFLDQPGVPFLEAKVTCDGGSGKLQITQSRYFPIGSKGDPAAKWQIPVCARFGVGAKTSEACALLTDTNGEVPLGACPDWLIPNAGASGYYRFGLGKEDLHKLATKGLPKLTAEERVAYGNALRAAFNRGTTPMGDLLEAAAPLVKDPDEQIAGEAMSLLETAHTWLSTDPLGAKVEAYGRRLYGPVGKGLRWDAQKGEDPRRGKLKQSVIEFLVLQAKDPAMRAEAKRRALAFLGSDGKTHPEALDPNLVATALTALAEDGDAALFDRLVGILQKTDDQVLRQRMIVALTSFHAPALAARGRALALDPMLRKAEQLIPIYLQMNDPVNREAEWAWVKENADTLLAQAGDHLFGGGQLLEVVSVFCDAAHADDLQAFLDAKASKVEGGARLAAQSIEQERLCIAKRAAQEPSARAFFSKN